MVKENSSIPGSLEGDKQVAHPESSKEIDYMPSEVAQLLLQTHMHRDAYYDAILGPGIQKSSSYQNNLPINA